MFCSTGDFGKEVDERGNILAEGRYLAIPLRGKEESNKNASEVSERFLAISQIRPGKEDRFLLDRGQIEFLGLNSLIGDMSIFKAVMSFAGALTRQVEPISSGSQLRNLEPYPKGLLRCIRLQRALTASI